MTKRIRGARLVAIRKAWFAENPLCVRCHERGIVRAATQLDHIKPLWQGGPDFDVDEGQNRQGLCDPCHDNKTREDLGLEARKPIGVDGWPVDD